MVLKLQIWGSGVNLSERAIYLVRGGIVHGPNGPSYDFRPSSNRPAEQAERARSMVRYAA